MKYLIIILTALLFTQGCEDSDRVKRVNNKNNQFELGLKSEGCPPGLYKEIDSDDCEELLDALDLDELGKTKKKKAKQVSLVKPKAVSKPVKVVTKRPTKALTKKPTIKRTTRPIKTKVKRYTTKPKLEHVDQRLPEKENKELKCLIEIPLK